MAEGGPEDSWWNWLQSAKEKVVSQSSEVLHFVKNDIDEFTKVVSEEASSVVSSTASALKSQLKLDDEESAANHVKKSVSGFLSHVAEVFTPAPDDDDEEAFLISNQQPVMLSRLEANIYTHVQDVNTFLQEPNNTDEYNKWLESFDLETKQVEMADLLVTCKPLHKHFSVLVPSQVSHTLFWHRYFYLVHRLQRVEEQRKKIASRAVHHDTHDMVWEDDEVISADADISEDMQTKLLQQYEAELLVSSSSSSGIVAYEDNANDAVIVEDDEFTEQIKSQRADDKKGFSGAMQMKAEKKTPNTKQPKSIMTEVADSAKGVKESASGKGNSTTSPVTQQRRSVEVQKNKNNAASERVTAATDNETGSKPPSGCSTPSSTGSKERACESCEDEWEKVDASSNDENKAGDSDSGVVSPGGPSHVSSPDTKARAKGEDWETWE